MPSNHSLINEWGNGIFALSGSLQPLELRMTLSKSFLSSNLLYLSSFPLPRLFLGSTNRAAVALHFLVHMVRPISMYCLELLTCMA
jgi:hypothetical protein